MRFWRRICIQYGSFCIDIFKSVVLYSNFTSKMHTLRHFLRVYPEKCRTVFKFYSKNRKIQKKKYSTALLPIRMQKMTYCIQIRLGFWILYGTFGDPYAKNHVLYSNSTIKMNTLRHFLACISQKCCTVFKFHTKNASILSTHVRKVL